MPFLYPHYRALFKSDLWGVWKLFGETCLFRTVSRSEMPQWHAEKAPPESLACCSSSRPHWCVCESGNVRRMLLEWLHSHSGP